ncbi:hypothetical protein AB5I41_23405 [Sphingomonas sp. MMS24-JH45]
MDTNEKLDKDRFRRDLGGEAEEAYQEVARRLGLLSRAAPRCSTWKAIARSGASKPLD